MNKKQQAISIRQKLLNHSLKLNVPYQSIETVFLIERLVARLVSNKQLRQNLIFKGGFVGLKVHESPRYTIDLDALLLKGSLQKTLEEVTKVAKMDLGDGVWLEYEGGVDLATQGEYGGVRQIYRAGIGEKLKNIKKAQTVHFDLGIGDPIVPGPESLKMSSLIEGNKEISWFVYPVETIVAEKFHALIALGERNSRSKDVYDLSLLLPKVDKSVLKQAISECFKHRELEVPESLADTVKSLNTKRLKIGWNSALISIQDPPDFDEVFKTITLLLDGL